MKFVANRNLTENGRLYGEKIFNFFSKMQGLDENDMWFQEDCASHRDASSETFYFTFGIG